MLFNDIQNMLVDIRSNEKLRQLKAAEPHEQGSDEGGPKGSFCIFGFAAISRWIFNVSNCLHSFHAVIF